MAVPTNIADNAALQGLVAATLPDYSEDIEDEYYDEAILATLAELSAWSLPCTDPFQMIWFIKRTKRHVLHVVAENYSRKFKYGKVNLEQRFNNLMKLIPTLDAAFLTAVENNPSAFGDINIENNFGTYAGNGFEYDIFGRAL